MGTDHVMIFEEIHESRLYPIDHRTPLNSQPTQYNAIDILILSYQIQLHSFYFDSDTAATTYYFNNYTDCNTHIRNTAPRNHDRSRPKLPVARLLLLATGLGVFLNE